ncbi:MAG: hypothetical protein WBX11_13225 [Thiobacillaceae bacterium]
MNIRATMKHWAIAVSLMILGGGLSACLGNSTIKWKEQVQLSDGRVIVVEREAIYVGGGDELTLNPGGTKINQYRIRFASTDGSGKTIEWRATKKDDRMYPEVPLLLDMPNGQPTVYTLVAISNGCEVYSKYIYQNGAWIEESLPEQFRQLTANLWFGSKRDIPKLLTLTEKKSRNTDGYRRAVKQIGPNRKVCG